MKGSRIDDMDASYSSYTRFSVTAALLEQFIP
jgi:hypothetical protein